MGQIEEIVERCRTIATDLSLSTVREWKKRNPQGQVVGHFPVYFPREIAHAGGMLPVALYGGGNLIEVKRADSRMASFICSICRTTLELGLDGRLDVLDVFVTHPICDAARHMAGVWMRNFPKVMADILHLPQNLVSEATLTYLYHEYQRLLKDLAMLTGRPITDDALRQSLHLHNRSRRLMREIYQVRRETPWLLSALESYLLTRAGTILPLEEYVPILEEVVAELPRRPERPRDKVRVVYEGAFCEQPPLEFIQVLEEVCYIVDDDFLLGAHYFIDDIPEGGDVLWNLAAAYRDMFNYSSVQHDSRQPKYKGLVKKARAARAEAVVLCPPKFCEPGLDDQVHFMHGLDKEGIPYLMLECEEKMTSFEGVRTQAETFAESILFYS